MLKIWFGKAAPLIELEQNLNYLELHKGLTDIEPLIELKQNVNISEIVKEKGYAYEYK